eukprot:Nitzschia sp. Nitz4//scaffold298_size22859//13581//14987//NITZ4_008531-RA/size22859-processed-gene-0.15-mRNA-1//-1//CDS//3329546329//2294//frame0
MDHTNNDDSAMPEDVEGMATAGGDEFEAPEFIDMNDAVEVDVDDDVPMEDDEEGAQDIPLDANDAADHVEVSVADMSKAKIVTHTDSVYSVAAMVEGDKLTILSGGGDDRAFMHSLGTTFAVDSSRQLPYAHTETVACVAFNTKLVSEDLKKTPRLAAAGAYDGTIIIYDPDTGDQKLKLEGPTDVEWLSFHPKGGSVLLAGSGDGTVWMFHVPLNRCLQVFVGHEQAVTAGCFSPDGKWALSASADGTLRVWAPKTGVSKHIFRTGEAGLTCMANNGGSDGMLVMVGAEDGQAHICHIGTKKVIASLQHFEVPAEAANQEDEDEEIEYPMSVEAVGFFPAQPNWCATGGVDGKLKIWDLDINGSCRHVCIPPAVETLDGPDTITRLQWHPKLPVIFTTSLSGNIRLWDARNGSLIHTLTGNTEMVNEVDIQYLDNGSALIVTAGDDKAVRVFEVDVNSVLQAAAVRT